MILSRRAFLKDIGLTAAAIGAWSLDDCQAFAGQSGKGRQPNIIYILADDLGYGDLGCFGQKMIKTPNLDRMAAEGMKFTQHYAGSTVCAPSRCTLMTGKHTGHCTVRGNVDVLMRPDEMTVAKVLKKAGYSTACIGKWGIGHPTPPTGPQSPQGFGFDHFFGYLSMWHAHNYYPDFLWKDGRKVPLRNVVRHPKKHYKPGQESLVGLASKKVDYSHDLFAQAALEYIVKHKAEPFFLYLPFTIPHANNEASLYHEHGMEVPDLGIYANKDWPAPEKGKAAMISRMDGDVGRILAKLKECGIDDDTLVIFSSDNGPHKEGGVNPEFFNSNGPLKGTKRDLYEGGIRVPTIARWPGKVKAGTECDHISAFWDVLPTFAELAGAPEPQGIDGISFAPALLGKPQKEHEYLYWEFHEGRSSKQTIRIGDFKAVRMAPSRPVELYNLRTDIGEDNNIASSHPDIAARATKIIENARNGADIWPLKDGAKRKPA